MAAPLPTLRSKYPFRVVGRTVKAVAVDVAPHRTPKLVLWHAPPTHTANAIVRCGPLVAHKGVNTRWAHTIRLLEGERHASNEVTLQARRQLLSA